MARSSNELRISWLLPLLTAAVPGQEAYTPFGAGCAGSAGVPVLAAAPGSLPRIGGTFTMQLSNLPPGNGSGFVIFGFSNTNWSGIPLPADLTPFGLFGCTLYASVDASFPVMTSMGGAEYSLPIPNDPSLLSLRFFNQGLVLDPGVNPFAGGAVVTNAAEGTVGPPRFGLTIEILGGTMGTAPQRGIRILRHDLATGAVLDDQLTGANGVVTFGMISTPRTTITIVEAPRFPGDDGCLVTLVDIPTGAATFQGGRDPVSQANFNVMLTGVHGGADRAAALLGNRESPEVNDASTITPPTADVFGVNVVHLQANGRFSIVTQVGVDGTGTTACGTMLDVDPMTIVPGSTLAIDTSASTLSIPYTANVPVYPFQANIRRHGLLYGGSFAEAPLLMAGSFTICNIPGADRYSFRFGTEEGPTQAGLGRFLQFDAAPLAMNVTMPSLNITGLSRNAGTRSLTWIPSGSDLGEIDTVGVDHFWTDVGTGSELAWEVFSAEGATSVTLPALPVDLAIFNPPATGVEFAVTLIGLDNVTGFDALLSAVSASSGNLDTVLFASKAATFASTSDSN